MCEKTNRQHEIGSSLSGSPTTANTVMGKVDLTDPISKVMEIAEKVPSQLIRAALHELGGWSGGYLSGATSSRSFRRYMAKLEKQSEAAAAKQSAKRYTHV